MEHRLMQNKRTIKETNSGITKFAGFYASNLRDFDVSKGFILIESKGGVWC